MIFFDNNDECDHMTDMYMDSYNLTNISNNKPQDGFGI